jgi:Protein of unknown function (DUF3168)
LTAAALALQEAMRAALLAHEPLVVLLGGRHVFDELPRGAGPSHVTFGEIETRDWSTASERAEEHFVTLAVRTNQRGRRLAQEICDEITAALDGTPLLLAGHRLVNLRVIFWNVAREKNAQTFAATLRFRAATEPT